MPSALIRTEHTSVGSYSTVEGIGSPDELARLRDAIVADRVDAGCPLDAGLASEYEIVGATSSLQVGDDCTLVSLDAGVTRSAYRR